VPLRRHTRDTAIKDIQVNEDLDWRLRILNQIRHYKKKAPYFPETYQLVEECMAVQEHFLSRLNVAILEKVCRHLGLGFEYEYFSEMDLNLGLVEGPGDWALRISERMGATEYVNPPGGTAIFDASKFEALGIKLTIRTAPLLEYTCGDHEFVPGLSIIDVLMWNSPNAVMSHLENHGCDGGLI
jgi:hypothetical protein